MRKQILFFRQAAQLVVQGSIAENTADFQQKTLDEVHTVQFNLHFLSVYCGPDILPVIGVANVTSTGFL